MNQYVKPEVNTMGGFPRMTGADFSSGATDSFVGPDGSDMNPGNLTGSGAGCVDSNRNGVCDFAE
jgi:hypothetical protein